MAGNQRGNSFGPMKKTKNNKQPTLFSLLKNQNTFVLELNSKRNKVIDLTENESPTGDLTKRQKIIHVPAPSPEKLKSSSSKIPKPVDNKKTLDKWFTRVTKREETKNKEKETVVIESTIKKKHFSRNLIQRMIKKKDTCRVCNETNTEIETRCNARCVGCDMTVHKVRLYIKQDLERDIDIVFCLPSLAMNWMSCLQIMSGFVEAVNI
jgi:hypothetical protein